MSPLTAEELLALGEELASAAHRVRMGCRREPGRRVALDAILSGGLAEAAVRVRREGLAATLAARAAAEVAWAAAEAAVQAVPEGPDGLRPSLQGWTRANPAAGTYVPAVGEIESPDGHGVRAAQTARVEPERLGATAPADAEERLGAVALLVRAAEAAEAEADRVEDAAQFAADAVREALTLAVLAC